MKIIKTLWQYQWVPFESEPRTVCYWQKAHSRFEC